MRTSIIRYAIVGILLLGLAIPGVTLAGDGGKGCSIQGTWFGVMDPPNRDMALTGWLLTVAGKSNNEGTNNLEYPNFDPTLAALGLHKTEPYSLAVGITNLRGVWKRTGGNTFDYTFTGFALDEANMPVYIAKVSGHVRLFGGCQYELITAFLEVYAWGDNPFLGTPILETPLLNHYGYRAKLDLPD